MGLGAALLRVGGLAGGSPYKKIFSSPGGESRIFPVACCLLTSQTPRADAPHNEWIKIFLS